MPRVIPLGDLLFDPFVISSIQGPRAIGLDPVEDRTRFRFYEALHLLCKRSRATWFTLLKAYILPQYDPHAVTPSDKERRQAERALRKILLGLQAAN